MSDYSDLIRKLRSYQYGRTIVLDASNALEAQAKQIEELHKQAAMNGRLLIENAELRERITELEAENKNMRQMHDEMLLMAMPIKAALEKGDDNS